MFDPSQRVLEELDRLGEWYDVMPCDPAYADTAAFCEYYGVDPGVSANTILVASKRPEGSYALCVVLATTRLDVNHKVRDLLSVRKLSFASSEQTRAVTGMLIGGVTPFGVPADIPIYVDTRVMDLDEMIVGGGGRSSKIRVNPRTLLRLPSVTVVDGLATDLSPRQDALQSDG